MEETITMQAQRCSGRTIRLQRTYKVFSSIVRVNLSPLNRTVGLLQISVGVVSQLCWWGSEGLGLSNRVYASVAEREAKS